MEVRFRRFEGAQWEKGEVNGNEVGEAVELLQESYQNHEGRLDLPVLRRFEGVNERLRNFLL